MKERAFVFAAILVPVILSAQGDLPVSRDTFGAASIQAKRDVLNGIINHNAQLPSADIAALIRSGLLDGDADVRVAALNAVASRASGPRWTASPNATEAVRDRVLDAWLSDKPMIDELRPMVQAALDDPEPRVRRNAVIALVNMDFNLEDKGLILSAQTVDALGARYVREPKAHVRDEIMKSLALSATDFPMARHTLIVALDDPDGHVRQYALMGAERLELQAALPKIVKALRDPDAHTRLLAAKALGAYDDRAAFAEELERALAAETDEIARGQMQRTLERPRQ